VKLEPLQEWICDTCGEVIRSPRDGWVEWLWDAASNGRHGFKIVHHRPASPRPKGCYQYPNTAPKQEGALDGFIGPDGLISLLDFLAHDEIISIKEFVELVRRLMVPNYEEARQYWPKAVEDGIASYSQESLGKIIEEYGATNPEEDNPA
jgi:hypothetical protein